MPTPMMQKLWADPKFRALSPGAQMEVAARYVWPELESDPKFKALSGSGQEAVRRRYAIDAVTFDSDAALGEQMKALMKQRLFDRTVGSDLSKLAVQGAYGVLQNSGILAAIDRVIEGPNAADARRRTLDFMRAAGELTGDANTGETLGSIAGVLTDIFAVNAAMGPLTGLARAGISTAARGGSAVVKAAGGLAKAPLMKPALEALGGVAAESAIEAIPYFLTEESRRKANGEPSVLSQGPMEVAKVLGINAAADFAVGALLQAGLMKGAKVLFGPNKVYEAAFSNEMEFQALRSQIRTGRTGPEAIARMSPIQQDAYRQRQAIDDFLTRGVVDPESARWTKDAYLAHDLGKIAGRADDGTYRLWKYGKDGNAQLHSYTNITDMENVLAYDAYTASLKLDDTAKDSFLRAHTNWALPRGKVLYEQQALLGGEKIMRSDPILERRLDKGTKIPTITKRPVITNGEAAALSAMDGSDVTVVQAHVPLKGDITDGINAGQVNFLKSSPSVRVSKADNPNMVFIGKKMATPEEYADATRIAQKVIAEDPSITLESARSSTLLDRGIDHFRHADGSVEFFAPRNAKLIGRVEDLLKKYDEPLKVGDLGTQAIVTEKRSFLVTDKRLRAHSNVLISAATKTMQTGDVEDLRNFGRLYLASYGSDIVPSTGKPIDIIVEKVKDLAEPEVYRTFDTLTMRVPSEIKTPIAQRRYVAKLLEGLDRSNSLKEPSRTVDFWAKKFTSRVQAFDVPYGVNKSAWIDEIAGVYGGKLETLNGERILRMPSGDMVSGTDDEILTWLTRRVADPNLVETDLSSQGVRISHGKGVVRAVSVRGRNVLGEAPTLPKLLDKLDYIPGKLDTAFGPKVLSIKPEGLEMELAGVKIFKGREDAMQFLSKFEDSKGIANERAIFRNSLGEVRALSDGSYKIHLPEFAATRHFDTLAEARKFLASADNPDFPDLREIAQSKFADITIRNGKYHVIVGKNRYTAGDLDELKTILREKIPSIEDSVPYLLDPAVESSVSDLVNQWKGAKNRPKVGPNPYNLPPELPFDERKALSAATVYETARSHTTNFTSWLEGYSKRTGNVPVAKAAASMREGLRQVAANTIADNRTMSSIFRGEKGKMVSKQSRIKIFYHLGATSPADVDVFAAQHKSRYGKILEPLTREEQIVADRVRSFMDDMGVRFGIRYQDLITNYMPRLRDLYDTANAELLMKVQTADDLVSALKVNIPKELKFWAENARVEDVTRYFLKDDALEVMMMYAAQGNKKLYLNEPWKEMAAAMKSTAVDEVVARRVDLYRENIMSSYHSNAERMLEDVGVKFAQGLKNGPLGNLIPLSMREMEDLGRNAYKSALGMTYFATMGWKPFLAIRNSFQAWTMTAPRVGLRWVSQAYKDVLDNPKPIMERLRKMGVLSEKPPVVNQVWSHDSLPGRIMEKSMEWFKNSDDMSRAVAYRACELRFNNAAKAWDMGLIKTKEAFFDMSGLDVVDPTTAEQSWTLFSTAGEDATKRLSAMDTYAFKVQRDTQFDYSGTDTPAMMQGGLMGKLFGQYGTYSAAYRANMANLVRYGSTAKKAEMVATYLATTTALWAGFSALRIKTNDFIPGAGAIFTGGPMFDIAIDAVKSLDPGYEGKQARARLADQVPRMLPGSAQLNSIRRFQEYQNQGDTYGAILSLLGTPVTPSW